MNKFIFSILLAGTFSGCSTMMEAVSPNDSTRGYTKTKTASGETVYRRERYAAPPPAHYHPPPEPVVIVEPPPPPPSYQPDPYPQDNHLVVHREEPIQLTDTQASPPTSDHTWALGVEASSDSKRAHLGALVFKKFDWLEAKAGISLFSADKDLYGGFDLGLRPMYQVVDNFSVFGGVGVYGGDAKRCSYDGDVEDCEKRFLFAGYVEAGVYLWNISLFARSYDIEEAGKKIPSDTFFGVGIRTTY